MARHQQPLSDYRKKKFESYMQFIDMNEDGFLSSEDYEIFARNLTRLSKATPEKSQKIHKDVLGWWDAVIGERGRDVQIPLKEVAQNCIEFYSSQDPSKLAVEVEFINSQFFDLIDLDGDGFISMDELRIYYRSLGVTNDNFIRDVFQRLDANCDDRISHDEFVRAFAGFWLSDDPESGFEFIYDLSHGKTQSFL